jgi:hypothetical protein
MMAYPAAGHPTEEARRCVRRATSDAREEGEAMSQRGGRLPTRWIVALGTLLLLVLAVIVAGLVVGSVLSSAAREGDFSFRTEQPKSIDELENSYELGSGSLELNLSQLDLPQETTEVNASVDDVGALTVVVPKGAHVRADAQADNGSVVLFGRTTAGEGVKKDFEDEGYDQAEQRLSLNLSVGTGVITVQREE